MKTLDHHPGHIYEGVLPDKVPGTIRFDVPQRLAGQHIEVAYGEPSCIHAPADIGSPWKRVKDEEGVVQFYRHVDVVYCDLCDAIVTASEHPVYKRSDGTYDHGYPPDFSR